jgi:hypothetical protein
VYEGDHKQESKQGRYRQEQEKEERKGAPLCGSPKWLGAALPVGRRFQEASHPGGTRPTAQFMLAGPVFHVSGYIRTAWVSEEQDARTKGVVERVRQRSGIRSDM